MNNRIQEIIERHAAATPSPWYYDLGGHFTNSIIYDWNDVIICSLPQHSRETLEADAAFISGSHADIAYLLSEIERLQTTLEWYADKNNYDPVHLSKYGYIPIDKDEGKRAREALSHLKG